MAKEYLLFAGDTYYPSGGSHDFIDSFDDVESAVLHVANHDYDWWHVAGQDDIKGLVILTSGTNGLYGKKL